MAGNFNKVILLGNLTRDVELRHTSGNTAVAKLGLAVNRRWRTPEGENREEVTFVDCEAWGRQAETLSKFLSKGRPVFIEGRLRLDQWEDKEGKKQSKLKVVIENFQFVDARGEGGGGAGGAEGGSGGGGGGWSKRGGGGRGGAQPTGQDVEQPFQDDDIPF